MPALMAACLGQNGAAELFLFGHFEKGIQEPLDSNFDQREKVGVYIYICLDCVVLEGLHFYNGRTVICKGIVLICCM